MIRNVLISLLLFLVPFILYALYLVLKASNPFDRSSWPARHVGALAVTGVLVSGVLFGLVWSNSGLQISGRNPEAERTISR